MGIFGKPPPPPPPPQQLKPGAIIPANHRILWLEGGAIELPRRPRTIRIEPEAPARAPSLLDRCACSLRRFFRPHRNPFTQ